MQVTPTMRGSFFAGIGLWVLVWALLFKGDEIAQEPQTWRRDEHLDVSAQMLSSGRPLREQRMLRIQGLSALSQHP